MNKKFFEIAIIALLIAALPLFANAKSPQNLLADAERDVAKLEHMMQANPEVDYKTFREIESFITIQASITVDNAKRVGADTRILEKKLIQIKRVLHSRNIKRVIQEMEDFSKLIPGDTKLGVEISKIIWSWRFEFRIAKENGVLISGAMEKRRKELEHLAFERAAEHALKEFKDYIDCKPTRFVSKSMFGWNVHSEALHSQTELAVRLVEALETPNAGGIGRDYESLRTDWFKKFVAQGPIHGMVATRDYMSVCSKEFK
ncbi:MAG: hypothetical protein A2934_02980 [Candidatus Sungbacteria bacterium RIFCSPLOWO2_01_FULL_47_10]|uniref:DUF5667 domain-containing protein n=1 Tax=Candidatus Sungbacteria bacterium RIFCSPLOWO2_01_FULL_47_10 TaxID=1802276 RepID=A0A1G2L8C0_9BACT|nr:MAG: hypothetical protein A2934_02980 [Candidatus Sungbacteria bacterium RIFCSPLOWO2_01_FULL_47_10]